MTLCIVSQILPTVMTWSIPLLAYVTDLVSGAQLVFLVGVGARADLVI